MKINTLLIGRDLKLICIEKYGNQKGLYICNKAEENFQKMKDEADYRNSDVIEEHMTKNIFPVLAYYMALLEYGFSTNDAYIYTLEETQKYATLLKIMFELI